MDGHVNYVQSRHQRVEPTADQFKLCVSDGQRTSAHLPFYVIIKAANDEVPEFAAGEVTVRQAGSGRFRLVLTGASVSRWRKERRGSWTCPFSR